MGSMYKKNASAIKRILSEAKEMHGDDSDEYTAAPLEDNLFEWHFTLRGPQNTPFEYGLYHGKILLPSEYPFKPPHVVFLTPNGRWQTNMKVCITFTGFHEESWQPAWGIRTALLGVQALMSSKADESGYGAVSTTDEEREKLAMQSTTWACPNCQKKNSDLLSVSLNTRAELPDLESRLPGLPSTMGPSSDKKLSTEPQSDEDLRKELDEFFPLANKTPASQEQAKEECISTPGNIPIHFTEGSENQLNSRQDYQTTRTTTQSAPMSGHRLSLVDVYESKIKTYRRVITCIDSLMGLVSGLLFLIILKNL